MGGRPYLGGGVAFCYRQLGLATHTAATYREMEEEEDTFTEVRAPDRIENRKYNTVQVKRF